MLLVATLLAALAAAPVGGQEPGAAGGQAPESAGEQAPGQALETFDEAWRIVDESHFDPEHNGVDWDAVREELRPRAAAATSVAALRAVLDEMLSRLGQSHFRLWPGAAVDAAERVRDQAGATVRSGGRVGLDVGWIDGAILVTEVTSGGPADDAGVATGWIVDAVDGEELVPLVEDLAAGVAAGHLPLEARRLVRAVLDGAPGSSVEARFRDGDDGEVIVTLERRSGLGGEGTPVKFGNLPALPARLERDRVVADGIEVGVIAFNIWLPPLAAQIDEAVDELRDADGIVVDLRDNPGGIGGMVMGVAGHFLDDRITLGTMRTRDNELRYVANPRRVNRQGERVEPFAGPLAIVVDGTSASTSEVFAGGLQAVGRARVFGDTTVGAVLPSLMERLPNGDVLQHAFADFVVPTGVRLEGRGVVPDVRVVPSRRTLLDGEDAVLEAALEWIVSTAAGNPPGARR